MATKGYVNPLNFDSIFGAAGNIQKRNNFAGNVQSLQSVALPTSDMSAMSKWTAPQPEFASMTSPMNNGFNSGIGPTVASAPGLPAAEGGWFDTKGKGGMLLGAAQVGLGVYSAIEQSQQNDFMKKYYTNQMNMQAADFGNAARSYNESASAKEGRRLDASQGLVYDSAANKAGRDAYMKTWGAKETF